MGTRSVPETECEPCELYGFTCKQNSYQGKSGRVQARGGDTVVVRGSWRGHNAETSLLNAILPL